MNMIKALSLPFALLLLLCAQAWAQLDVRLEPVRRDYLLGEKAALRLTLINHTDSPVELKSTPGRPWLHLEVARRGDPTPLIPSTRPSFPDAKIMPGSRKAYTLELQPQFRIIREGIYHVSATVRMPDMRSTFSSAPASFNMSSGGTVRSFNIQARGQRLQLLVKVLTLDGKTSLFGQVVNPETRVPLGACFLGRYLNFMEPRILLDRAQNLHLLCQSTADLFTYAVMDTFGNRSQQRILKRTGGVVDLIGTGSGIRYIGLAPYVKESKPNSPFHSATERP